MFSFFLSFLLQLLFDIKHFSNISIGKVNIRIKIKSCLLYCVVKLYALHIEIYIEYSNCGHRVDAPDQFLSYCSVMYQCESLCE